MEYRKQISSPIFQIIFYGFVLIILLRFSLFATPIFVGIAYFIARKQVFAYLTPDKLHVQYLFGRSEIFPAHEVVFPDGNAGALSLFGFRFHFTTLRISRNKKIIRKLKLVNVYRKWDGDPAPTAERELLAFRKRNGVTNSNTSSLHGTEK